MTTMVWGMQRWGFSGSRACRWRASVVHGGVMAALLAGVGALWTAMALMVALLAHPVPTMTTLEREGARGVPKVVRQGSVTVLAELRKGVTGRGAR